MQKPLSSLAPEHRWLKPLAALALSLLLLLAGFSALTAPAPVQAAEVAALPLPVVDLAPDLVQATVRAPLAISPTFDLAISKNHVPLTFTVGANNVYILSVVRVSPITNTINLPIFIQDELPAGMTWTPQNIGKWNCLATSSPTLVSCYYTENNPANFEQLNFSVNVDATLGGTTVNNTAKITSVDLNSDNNTATTTTNVQPGPTPTPVTPTSSPTPVTPIPTDFDLKITKSQIPSKFKVGTGNIYVINVSRVVSKTINQLVVVEDDLPDGLTWTPANVGKWNCITTSTATLVSCFYSENNAITFDQLQFQVNVAKDVNPTTFNNTAVLKITDGNDANNTATIVTQVDSTDLQIKKTVFPTSIVTGTISYTLVVTNTGPVTATNVKVEETIPVDLTYLSADGLLAGEGETAVLNGANTILTWTIPNIPVNITRTLTLNFHTKPSATGKVIKNTAKVTSGNYNDWNTTNNTSSAEVVVGGLEITKLVTPKVAIVGEFITITLQVHNPTNSQFTNVVVNDKLHEYLLFRKAQAGVAFNSSTSSWSISAGLGKLDPGETKTVWAVVSGTPSISNTVEIENQASVTWGLSGSEVTVYSNIESFEINPGGSLYIEKQDARTTVLPGTTFTYTVNLTNTGNLAVNNIVITETLGQHLSLVNLAVPAGYGSSNCNIAGYPNTCRITLTTGLATNTKTSFKVAVKVNAAATLNTYSMNTVQASGRDEFAQTMYSNRFVDQNLVNVAPVFNLTISKTVRPNQARVDDSFTFKISATNLGSEVVSGIKIQDIFPSVLDLTSVTTDRGTGTLNTGARSVDVNVGDLQPGQVVNITIVAKVNATATEIKTYDNIAKLLWTYAGTTSEMLSNNVRFRVLPKATLPSTGWVPALGLQIAADEPADAAVGLFASIALAGGVILGLLGLLLLGYSLVVRARHPLRAGPITTAGLLLTALGLFAVMAGAGLGSLSRSPDGPPLAMLPGAKPPFATRPLPLPTRTRPPEPTDDFTQYLPTPTPLSLPDYPVPLPTAMVTQGPQGIEPDASNVTRIIVPKMGLDTEVKYVPFDGQTWMIGGLKQEIAWMGDTSWPGLGSNTALAGHVDLANGDPGPFWNLKDLKPGDEVVLYTQKNRYTYVVSQQTVVNDYELHVIDPSDDPRITLITCVGWDAELSAYLQRLIIFATLKDIHPLQAN